MCRAPQFGLGWRVRLTAKYLPFLDVCITTPDFVTVAKTVCGQILTPPGPFPSAGGIKFWSLCP